MAGHVRRKSSPRAAALVATGVAAVLLRLAPAEAATAPLIATVRCGDGNGDGRVTVADALAALRSSVSLPSRCTPLSCDATGGADGIRATDALLLLRVAVGVASPSALRCPSAARLWNEQALDAIRLDLPRPPVHARNLFHLSVAAWDAWVAYDQGGAAQPLLFHEKPPVLPDADTARSTAISYASYRVLWQRVAPSPNAATSRAALDATMASLGLDPAYDSLAGDSPADVGNRLAVTILAFGDSDGSNEAGNYADTTGYAPANEPLDPESRGTTMADPNRWQPLSLRDPQSQNGIPLPNKVQSFVCPHWGGVTPFALQPFDPGTPPRLGAGDDAAWQQAAMEVLRHSGTLDPADAVVVDASPASRGNNPLGTNDGHGHARNLFTGRPYTAQPVLRADLARVRAEYWADGPRSETPPGHWNLIANRVADDPRFQRRLAGKGAEVGSLEWDAKVYLALNGALHDAAIAAWGTKGATDSARPISMIRWMAGHGQSSDPLLPSYDPRGMPLEAGVAELVTPETSAPGQRHAALADHVGEVAVRAWRGPRAASAEAPAGVDWILGEDWMPYQASTFVTPAFAGYFSGHSVFSRSAAEVLTAITGSAFFPGGLAEVRAAAGDFLRFEQGPTTDVVLQWATYRDAADDAGASRIDGGIHVPADDFAGRIRGERIGKDAWSRAQLLFGAGQAAD